MQAAAALETQHQDRNGRARSPALHRIAQRGVTLVESMIVVAILGTMTAVAGPSFARLFAANSVTNDVNTFLADVQFTRGESLKRGISVTMCRSEDVNAANPTCAQPVQGECAAGTGACVKGSSRGGWETGWLVFVDGNADGRFNPGEQLLRVQQRLSNSGGIHADESASYDQLTFRPTGWAPGPAASLRFLPKSEQARADAKLARTVCISTMGRTRSINSGDGVCV